MQMDPNQNTTQQLQNAAETLNKNPEQGIQLFTQL